MGRERTEGRVQSYYYKQESFLVHLSYQLHLHGVGAATPRARPGLPASSLRRLTRDGPADAAALAHQHPLLLLLEARAAAPLVP